MNADTDTATQPAPGGAASDGQDRIAPPLLSDIETARSAFKTSLVQLGLILRFHRDVQSLGVASYASQPPASIANALKDAVTSYRDACDRMEAVVLQARQAVVSDLEKHNPSHQQVMADASRNTNSHGIKAEGEQGAMAVDPVASTAAGLPPDAKAHLDTGNGSGESKQGKGAGAASTEDGMEDLFGPGSGETSPNAAASSASDGAHQDGAEAVHSRPEQTASAPASQSAGDSAAEAHGLSAPGSFSGNAPVQLETAPNPAPAHVTMASAPVGTGMTDFTGIDLSQFGITSLSSLPETQSLDPSVNAFPTLGAVGGTESDATQPIDAQVQLSGTDGIPGGLDLSSFSATDFDAMLAGLSGSALPGGDLLQNLNLSDFDINNLLGSGAGGLAGEPASQQQG